MVLTEGTSAKASSPSKSGSLPGTGMGELENCRTEVTSCLGILAAGSLKDTGVFSALPPVSKSCTGIRFLQAAVCVCVHAHTLMYTYICIYLTNDS